MKTKQELQDDFDWWITCIPDKIEHLKKIIPIGIFIKLDYSLDSLQTIGEYICEKIQSIENLKYYAELWDCTASYLATTYRRNVPTAKWQIELNDVENGYYGIPALITDANTNFYPKYEITAMLDRKRTDFLYAITKRHIELQKII
jgi:glutaredoxin-related protein